MWKNSCLKDVACFQQGMAYADFKDLSRRTIADKVLRDKAFDIANNSQYDGNTWNCFNSQLIKLEQLTNIFLIKN